MAEGSANKARISDRDKKVLFIVAGIVILALAYFLGFQKMMQSRSALVEENITLDTEVNKLLAMVAEKAKVEGETQKYKTDREEILAQYPPDLRTQDVIYQLDLLEQKIKNLVIETEGFTMNQIFFTNGALTESSVQDVAEAPAGAGASGEAVERITGYRSDVTTSYKTTYKKLKDIVGFVTQNENRMVIDTLTVAQSEGEKELTCNMALRMYAVGGTEKEYKPSDVPVGKMGKENALFATGND